MRIDVHAHYFPVEYLDRLDRYGGSKTTAFFRKANLAFDGFSGLAEHFRNMDIGKVDLQVLSVSGLLPYFANESDAVDAARLGNDFYAHRPPAPETLCSLCLRAPSACSGIHR